MTTTNKISSNTLTRQFLVFVLTTAFCAAAYTQETMTDDTAAQQMDGADTAQEQPAPASTPPETSSNADTIGRAQFTTAIVDREPTDDVATVSNDTNDVYFFTEIVNAQGETYTHRWEYEGQQMAEVTFNIGGPRWRVYSKKSIKPEWTGMWTVTVLDSAGNPLKVSNLEVVEAKQNN